MILVAGNRYFTGREYKKEKRRKAENIRRISNDNYNKNRK